MTELEIPYFTQLELCGVLEEIHLRHVGIEENEIEECVKFRRILRRRKHKQESDHKLYLWQQELTLEQQSEKIMKRRRAQELYRMRNREVLAEKERIRCSSSAAQFLYSVNNYEIYNCVGEVSYNGLLHCQSVPSMAMRGWQSDIYWLQLDDMAQTNDGDIVLTDARRIPYYGKAENQGKEAWKFIVVWKGIHIGIFDQWSDAHPNVTNVSGSGFQSAKGWRAALEIFLSRHPEGYPAQRATTIFPTTQIDAAWPSAPHMPVQSRSSASSVSSSFQSLSEPRDRSAGSLEEEFASSLVLSTEVESTLDSNSSGSSCYRKSRESPLGDIYAVRQQGSPGTTIYANRNQAKKAVRKRRADGTLHSVRITPSLNDAFDFAASSSRNNQRQAKKVEKLREILHLYQPQYPLGYELWPLCNIHFFSGMSQDVNQSWIELYIRERSKEAPKKEQDVQHLNAVCEGEEQDVWTGMSDAKEVSGAWYPGTRTLPRKQTLSCIETSSKMPKGKTGNPRGRPGWVTGNKLVYLERYFTEWRTAREAGKVGEFYTLMTKRLYAKFGEQTAKGDATDETEDPEDEALDIEMDNKTEEELKEFQANFKDRRKKVGDWFNARNRRSSKGEENILYSLFERVAEVLPNAPRRPREMQFYSSLYWTEKIKPAGEKRPATINIANEVSRKLWAAEPEEVRVEVRRLIEEHHARNMKEYNFARDNPGTKTGSDYYLALVSLSALLQKLVDACQDYFGMATSILLCGPIPESGGNVEVRSLHSGTIKGTSTTWPDFDPTGFQQVENLMIKFGLKVFSAQECRDRALSPQELTAAQEALRAKGVAESTGTNADEVHSIDSMSVAPNIAHSAHSTSVASDAPRKASSTTLGARSTHPVLGKAFSTTVAPNAHCTPLDEVCSTSVSPGNAHSACSDEAHSTSASPIILIPRLQTKLVQRVLHPAIPVPHPQMTFVQQVLRPIILLLHPQTKLVQ
ncbi:hypothetical protein BDP27DRAFT_1366504 [Rhodocollybia butyracea]|uniref:Ribonuclease H1 N-terminal domain-containing protein n=1 Tax=Rhodocollybia butyracea TaxID=206335 RepID=A0A9P5PKW8_9AGAR|nr:hypothetical protein BDP27DRAFT_1366504 [Rhodocollybia butyracea]